MEINKVKITPELAKFYLSKNTKNRNLSKSHVSALAAIIQRGEWIEDSGDMIRFTGKLETLIDGQHRLNAIIAAGQPVYAYVATNCDPNAFKTIDTGKKRAASDVLSIEGVKNSHSVAASIRIYLIRKNKNISANASGSAEGKNGTLYANKNAASNALILETYNELNTKYDFDALIALFRSLYDRSVLTIPLTEFIAQAIICLENRFFSESEIHELISPIGRENVFVQYFQTQKLRNIALKQSDKVDCVSYFFFCLKKGIFPKIINKPTYVGKFEKMFD